MIRIGGFVRIAIGLSIATAHATPALALPTMVRLGYTNCAACHVTPQGGGPLTDYGRGIDQAQSLRGGEYRPSEAHRRFLQDLRVVLHEQATWTEGGTPNVLRPRLIYRNVSQLSSAFRLSGAITFEGLTATRPPLSYDPAARPARVSVDTALVHYRPRDGIEIAAGRDRLPGGINVPDLELYIKSRNRLGYYDSPTQLKMFWWGSRHQVTPFVFGPGGNEAAGERESGAGTVAEFDLFGHQRTVVGVTVLRAVARNGDRQLRGGYARLGFGRWGVLGEHDVTDRTRTFVSPKAFRQTASYAQVFWAAREWLTVSTIAERLRVARPFEQRLNAGRIEVAARLASQATITLGGKVEKDNVSGRLSKSLILQMALKTVNSHQ
jgi:hypothetical protein